MSKIKLFYHSTIKGFFEANVHFLHGVFASVSKPDMRVVDHPPLFSLRAGLLEVSGTLRRAVIVILKKSLEGFLP